MTRTVTCTICGAESPADTTFCSACGRPLQFHRDVILKDNCWQAAPDELAVFFRVGHLKGLFSKQVVVPAGMRALIIQDGTTEEVGHGTHAIDTLLARLNRFFRDKHADILITRQNALPIEFAFDDIVTAEFLKVGVTAALGVRIDNAAGFAQHFMTTPGCVTMENVRDLIAPAVRQVLADYVGALSLREMVGKSEMRDQISMRLNAQLRERFAAYGLRVEGVTTLTLRHDKFMQNRQLEGSLWLVADEQKVRLAHQRDLDALYSEDEWRKIKREEEDVRLRYRRAELRQEEAELAHTIRLREIELFERVKASDTRQKAIALGAADAVAQLEADFGRKEGEREDDAARWEHLRRLAELKQNTEWQLEDARAQISVQMEQLRLQQDIEKLRLTNEIEQANLIEDEEAKRERRARLRAGEAATEQREQVLIQARHEAGRQEIELGTFARRREVERVQEYEDSLAQSCISDIGRETENKDIKQAHEHLERLRIFQAKRDQDEFEARERERKVEFERESLRRKADEDARLQTARTELERIEAIGRLPITAQIAIAQDGGNAAALAELAKLDAFKGMDTDQILAYNTQFSAAAAEVLRTKYSQTGGGEAAAENHALQGQLAAQGAQLNDLQNRNDSTLREFRDFGNNALREMKEAVIGVAQAGRSAAAPAPTPAVPTFTPPPKRIKPCPTCATDNAEDARFCSKCGASLK